MFRAGIPESGILRKHKVLKENLDDLLVFGYACKLFRDDEKALYIDQGKHLIPWMGDETLRIDRYDGRGTLSDLKSCEANREGYDTTRWLGLNESERKVEQLCDEERYYSLTSNEEEELLYKEEELKRQKANEFQYNYDDSSKSDDNNSQTSIPTVEQDDRHYVPRPELDVPADISIPKTIKENARIEKTAMFVSQQGLQMEILIKAKQANNPQFSFMNQADLLYKYYRHVVSAFKSGRYTMTEYGNTDDNATPASPIQQDTFAAATDQAVGVHYIHPSLGTTQLPPPPLPVNNPNANSVPQLADQTTFTPATPVPPVPTLTYRPRADCAYTQLITRIKGAQQLHKEQHGVASGDKGSEDSPGQAPQNDLPPSGGDVLTVEQQQQYFQYYYTLRYYDGYKQLGEQYTTQGLDPQLLLQNTAIQEQIQAQAVQYAQTALTAYMAQCASAASTAVSTDSTAQSSPICQSTQVVNQITEAPAQITTVESTAAAPQAHVKKSVNPLLTLAHYGSDSEEDCGSENENEDGNCESMGKKVATSQEKQSKSEAYMVPPEDISVIIDKMAAYVSKNGADFENIVRSRGDPRFEFLTPEHEYHSFYKHKLKEHLGSSQQNGSKNAESKDADNKHNGSTTKIENSLEKKLPVPVSFSIKTRDDSQKEIKQSALPMEESSDDEENKSPTNENNQQQQEVTVIVNNDIEKSIVLKNAFKPAIASTKDVTVNSVNVATSKSVNIVESRVDKDNGVGEVEASTSKVEDRNMVEKRAEFEDDDPLLEMIDLTDDLDDKSDDALKSKFLQHEHSKALQLERRRKAAAFLRLRSMMNVYKSIESQVNAKENDAASSKKRKSAGGGSSKESSPKVSTREGSVGRAANDTVRARRASTQSRSSDVVEIIDDSDDLVDEEKGKKKQRKNNRKKKSHKRKHSKSSRSRRDGSSSPSSRRKTKKHRKRSPSRSKISRSRSRLRSSSRSS